MNKTEYYKINKTHHNYVPLIVIATLSINILSLALPLTMKQIYSRIIVYRSMETLLILIIGCVIALLMESILRKTKESTTKWISSKQEYLLSNYIVQKTLKSASTNNKEDRFNSYLERFRSIGKITSFYSTGFYQMYIDAPFMFIFLYLIFYLGRSLVLVPVILSLIYVGIMLIISIKYSANREVQVKAQDKLMAELTESIDKIHLIKAAGIESYQISKYKKALNDFSEVEYKVNTIKMLPDNISSYLSKINLFAMLAYGGYLLMQGNVSFGEITACAILGGRAIGPIQSIMKLYMTNNDIKLLKKRIDEIALQEDQYEESVPFFPEDILGNIELIDVSYDDNLTSKKINAKINSGSFLVVDPSKFVDYKNVLKQITGSKDVKSGKVLIDSLDITEWNMNSLKGKIEYLSENVSIFKGSIIDNVTYFNNEKRRDVYEAAALTGFDKLVTQMPEGFETILDSQSINYLSTAFIQRLNLTRGFIYRPRVLILDRLAESMDKETLEIFKWILKMLRGKVTIIVVTYDKEIQKMADYYLLEEGIKNA